MKKVAVVAYGLSSEKDISLLSGQGVLKALIKKGYDASLIKLTDNIAQFIKDIEAVKPDVIFNALHGKHGEDGCVQGLFNLMKIPYTHSGVLASALGMDKSYAKKIFASVGIPVAPELLVTLAEVKAGKKLPYPYVIKPIREGSSVGVHIIENADQELTLIQNWPYAGAVVMMESYIKGRETTVSVLNDRVLGVTEIAPKHGFYDFQNKYQAGCTDHIIPAPIPAEDAQKMMDYALKAHKALGCRGASRTDFRYDDTDAGQVAKIVALEINTQPGMTELSLLPESAKYAGISYEDLVSLLVEEAQCDK